MKTFNSQILNMELGLKHLMLNCPRQYETICHSSASGVTATTAISPTWSINRANTSGINSWKNPLPGTYHLILRCTFTYSRQWQSSPRGDASSCRWSLCLTRFKRSTVKNKQKTQKTSEYEDVFKMCVKRFQVLLYEIKD